MSWRMHFYCWAYLLTGVLLTLFVKNGVPLWFSMLFCTCLVLAANEGIKDEINKGTGK